MTGGGSVVVRRQLGAKLRALRLAAGKDVADVVEAGLASKAKISRIENGRSMVKINDVLALAWLYGADQATVDTLAALAPATQQEDWWEPYSSAVVPDYFGLYIGLEGTASRLRCWEPELVLGLLQTEDYARAVIGAEPRHTPDLVEQRVKFRKHRQRRLLGNRPDLTVILGAGALSLVVGSPAIMAAQLDHLRRLDCDGVATVRVLPWSVGAYPMRGTFSLLDFDDEEDPSVAYVESIMGAWYLDRPAQVAEYESVFQMLADRAIPVQEWAV